MSHTIPRSIAGAVASAWLLALAVAFFLHRADDAGQLGALLARGFETLARKPLAGTVGAAASVGGLLVAGLMVLAWFGLGDAVLRALRIRRMHGDSPPLAIAARCLYGSALWSMVWFTLGVAHLYRDETALAALAVGLALAAFGWRRSRSAASAPPFTMTGRIAVALTVTVLILALMAALAPPTARDALFYHFSIPKAYVAARSSAVVPYNMATYYPQGVEMQVVWAMLVGRLIAPRVGETAAGTAVFAFAPLLALAVYGWARERRVDPTWASIAALMVAAIPTVYDIAGSGYVDLALAAYTALAVRGVARWWSTLDRGWVVPIAIPVAGALSIKLTAGFVVLALTVIVLLRAGVAPRGSGDADPARRSSPAVGLAALVLGALIATPWYVRTWMRTGSPVFPFYVNIWPGHAPGWDVDRSRLYQSLLSMYGDAHGALGYVLAPVRLAIEAQPDQPAYYDGVLGIAFLFALPWLVWALYRRRLDADLRIATLVSSAMFVFWLLSSQQLRFLLPALPGVAVAMAASGMMAENTRGDRWLRWLFLAATAPGLVVILAWFTSLDPIRVTLGGESRSAYLSRRLDYYPYYELINEDLPPSARVWLINMRRDTYHLDRPYFSDFVFEDYTLAQQVRDARSADDLRAWARAAGITHLLVRHDVLLDYARSPIVDDRLPRERNLTRLQILADFLRGGTRLLRADRKFMLVELPRDS